MTLNHNIVVIFQVLPSFQSISTQRKSGIFFNNAMNIFSCKNFVILLNQMPYLIDTQAKDKNL
jgi:gamma-glutamyltranspeptidase